MRLRSALRIRHVSPGPNRLSPFPQCRFSRTRVPILADPSLFLLGTSSFSSFQLFHKCARVAARRFSAAGPASHQSVIPLFSSLSESHATYAFTGHLWNRNRICFLETLFTIQLWVALQVQSPAVFSSPHSSFTPLPSAVPLQPLSGPSHQYS